MNSKQQVNFEITEAEARCAELHEHWLKAEGIAAFHERHGHFDADNFRRRAEAWRADYDSAVRDLNRLRADAAPRSDTGR